MLDLLTGSGGFLGVIGVLAVAVFGLWRAYIRKTKEAVTERGRRRAAEERLKMREERDSVRREAEGLTDEDAREEALKWSRQKHS